VRFVAVEVGDQDFDLAVWVRSTYLTDRFGPVSGAAVWQIVAVN
jgi:hypothetical protein